MANGMYLICLNLKRANQIGDPEEKKRVIGQAGRAVEHLKRAAERYAESKDEGMAESVIAGMRALHSFEGAKRLFLDYLKESQQDNTGGIS